MSIALNDNIRIEAPKLIDDRTKKPDNTAYSSKTDVLSTIIESRRSLGLVVLINQDFYYFKTGITQESHLQPLTGTIDAVQSITGDLLDLTDPKNPIIIYDPSDYDLSAFGNASSNIFVRQTDLDTKVDKIPGWGLTQNNYTTVEKNKLLGIENLAQVNKIETVKVNDLTIAITSPKTIALNIDRYSTTEIRTEGIWTNNKPIYRTVIQYSLVDPTATISISSMDIEEVIPSTTAWLDAGFAYLPVPVTANTSIIPDGGSGFNVASTSLYYTVSVTDGVIYIYNRYMQYPLDGSPPTTDIAYTGELYISLDYTKTP